ncbi:hypothetical protein GUJ93_ZPchr0013g37486 [Zizania palustris]|uniref:Uncharacterized protein n=1 Tax=Zizania palustris TaxID=103762 RepID=A0A8J5X3Q2_ZIZPA|nr:hypothetical protein GUJ93_ZPchr0013g37486 [Zizania palustris]
MLGPVHPRQPPYSRNGLPYRAATAASRHPRRRSPLPHRRCGRASPEHHRQLPHRHASILSGRDGPLCLRPLGPVRCSRLPCRHTHLAPPTSWLSSSVVVAVAKHAAVVATARDGKRVVDADAASVL